MNAANLSEELRYKLFKESHQCACLTDGLGVITKIILLKPDMNIGMGKYPHLHIT